jgi:hypothetical protein
MLSTATVISRSAISARRVNAAKNDSPQKGQHWTESS